MKDMNLLEPNKYFDVRGGWSYIFLHVERLFNGCFLIGLYVDIISYEIKQD